NHLEAHALTARLSDDVAFPYLLLLVSGGHTQLLVCGAVGDYRQLGTCRDDAAGEAFDKTAKLLGLGYPGGPATERGAERGDPRRFELPGPLKRRPGCDFSFSGLKTAVRQIIAAGAAASSDDIADLAAAIELAICDTILDRTGNAVGWFRQNHPEGRTLVVAGGVAANAMLRRRVAARAGSAVTLWARDPAVVAAINHGHENPLFLPGITLDPAVSATTELQRAIAGAEAALLVVPAQFLRSVLASLAPVLPVAMPL